MNQWEKLKFKIRKHIVIFLQLFTKKDTYIMFDNLYETSAECIDTYCIFRYMQKNNIKSYYVVYKENPTYKEILRNNKNIIVIKESVHDPKSFEFFTKTWRILPKTKAVITLFGDIVNQKITNFLYKNEHINYVHVDHGSVFLKTFIVSTDYFSCKKYNKFVVSNPIEQEIFMQYGWKKENLPIIGLPRWDNLKREPQSQKNIFVMFTWRTSFGRWNRNKFKTPIEKTKYHNNIQSFLNNSELHDILEKYNIKIRVAFHHALLRITGEKYKTNFPNVEIVACENISRYIGKSDLFITDYSSLFFDFAFLDTPIVFYRPDFDDESLLELDKQDMKNAKSKDKFLYNICYTPQEAIQCIKKYIENGFLLEEENKLKNKSFFSHKEHLTQKLINYLEDL